MERWLEAAPSWWQYEWVKKIQIRNNWNNRKRMDAIDKFIEYLEKDIEFDQNSYIKTKQLKEILIHEKTRLLDKAKFYKRYSTYKISRGSGKIVGHGLDGHSTIDDCNCKK